MFGLRGRDNLPRSRWFLFFTSSLKLQARQPTSWTLLLHDGTSSQPPPPATVVTWLMCLFRFSLDFFPHRDSSTLVFWETWARLLFSKKHAKASTTGTPLSCCSDTNSLLGCLVCHRKASPLILRSTELSLYNLSANQPLAARRLKIPFSPNFWINSDDFNEEGNFWRSPK